MGILITIIVTVIVVFILDKVIRKDRDIVYSQSPRRCKFQAWDKEHKEFWHDFRIHPQGFVAPATKEKDGYWVYDWKYPQERIVLITGSGIRDGKRTKRFPEGQEIWERDIIKYVGFDGKEHIQECPWLTSFHFWQETKDNKTVEIIGNKFENPKLLK